MDAVDLTSAVGLDADTLKLTLGAIDEFVAHHVDDKRLLELDHEDRCPEDIVRGMCSDELGIQLLFIPEEYGGMGGATVDVYRICERMARVDVGLATSVLATFLGSDPIFVGATPEQKKLWLTRIAEEGLLFAYGATEPEAGSDLGALKTTATPVTKDGQVVGYRINGRKQWISNGGIADVCTVLAMAPGGPSWFIVDTSTSGFEAGKREDKHGIRLSNTAALFLDEIEVGVDRLIGGVEGLGLTQAQEVFGYTRLMVAAFGLGAGWAALDRAIPYSAERIQAGGPLSEKTGYTNKLIVPHVCHLEAGRAMIEEVAARIDAGEGSLNTEGAVAKYLASEAGNWAADAAIQALGGYGYTREYMVEKIKRDVRITTIYEGTSEIMEMTIARDRWQQHLKTRGRYYHDLGDQMDELERATPQTGAAVTALALHALAEVYEHARLGHLTRNQHVLLRLGELSAWVECAAAFARRVAAATDSVLSEKADRRFDAAALGAMSRVYAREAAMKVVMDGLRWVGSSGTEPQTATELSTAMRLADIVNAQAGTLEDMDMVADAVYGRTSS